MKAPASPSVVSDVSRTVAETSLKDALLAEIRTSKAVLYNMVIAQAQTVEVSGDRVTFTFSAAQAALREKFDQNRAWLESVAQQISGRRMIVAGAQANAAAVPSGSQDDAGRTAADTHAADKKTALRARAMADSGVQALLEVFPAEIRDVEEM